MITNTLAIPELTSTEYVFNYIHYLLCTVCSEQYRSGILQYQQLH